ncbi:MAG TPA: aminoglycoside phosphotransferase family protein [Anaerolineales bacterium]|nr:aminoglycoside phosphotransferase family protein [Anaerolineales bacterium]
MAASPVLDAYLKLWDLGEPTLLTRTHTSTLYTVRHGDETVVLKLLAPGEVEEQRGALALKCFAGRGAVRLMRHDAGAQLLEYAAGEELIAVVERGDDAAATRIIAGVLNELHAAPDRVADPGLMPLERWFRALLERGAQERLASSSTVFTTAAAVAERLLAEPREVRVLHGDIHHRNIRASTRGWLAFDPKGLFGERTYDCANTLCNPPIPELVHNEARLLAQAALLADALALDPDRIVAFAYAYSALNAAWWLKLGDDSIVAWSLAVARLLEPHVRVG